MAASGERTAEGGHATLASCPIRRAIYRQAVADAEMVEGVGGPSGAVAGLATKMPDEDTQQVSRRLSSRLGQTRRRKRPVVDSGHSGLAGPNGMTVVVQVSTHFTRRDVVARGVPRPPRSSPGSRFPPARGCVRVLTRTRGSSRRRGRHTSRVAGLDAWPARSRWHSVPRDSVDTATGGPRQEIRPKPCSMSAAREP